MMGSRGEGENKKRGASVATEAALAITRRHAEDVGDAYEYNEYLRSTYTEGTEDLCRTWSLNWPLSCVRGRLPRRTVVPFCALLRGACKIRTSAQNMYQNYRTASICITIYLLTTRMYSSILSPE